MELKIRGALEIQQTFQKELVIKNSMNMIRWLPPPMGSVKLNTDGASKGNPGKAGAGGLLRSDSGEWLMGFQASLGFCSNIAAELQALKLGLLLTWSEGFRFVFCELDAKVVLDLIASADTHTHPFGCIIEDIRVMLQRPWKIHLSHTYREGNFCADQLAKKACDIDTDFVKLVSPPSFLSSLIEADAWGVCFSRNFQL